MKRLWVIAGPNGTGKTTITSSYIKNNIPIINPDVIAVQISPNFFNNNVVTLQAGRAAIKEREKLLIKNKSFAIETTLSGKHELEFINKAKRFGFKIFLIYIATSSYNISIGRILQRVIQGGHSVKIDDIIRRYSRSLKNLSQTIQIADKSIIINNDERPKLVMAIANNKIYLKSRELPSWVTKSIPKNLE